VSDAYHIDHDEKDFDDVDVLVGPDGFQCVLGEPEDRSWLRDGRDAVARLNQQHETIATLRRELAEARAEIDEIGHTGGTSITRLNAANARAAAVSLDNALLLAAAEAALAVLEVGVDPGPHHMATLEGRAEWIDRMTPVRERLRAALASAPDGLVERVRSALVNGRQACFILGDECEARDEGADADDWRKTALRLYTLLREIGGGA
jgi:hypothetical protein